MKQNELVRRYRVVTGAQDLDDFEPRRNNVSFFGERAPREHV